MEHILFEARFCSEEAVLNANTLAFDLFSDVLALWPHAADANLQGLQT